MTIYYSLTFMLLAAEMATFCVLVTPLPHNVKKKLFSFLSTSPIIAKVAYALKISFIFVAILFFDALQRMWRVAAESEQAKSGTATHDVRTETNFAARKFYSQRNVYLTGFTLFLSLVLTRTFSIIIDLIHAEEELRTVRGTDAPKGGKADPVRRVKLQKELDSAKKDLQALKSQAKSQADEYNRLADRYNKATGSDVPRRKGD
ncbi:B-cell receptor-associated 31-like protein [Cylindrobasidium torrendii FP15055 ss-10]|uniref:Endoplasmic reticulum transmembrane protein n=1 Tax=Cylindrobasidium torrendii FP15055 ss-10 TaxID=1314674 RepID=A0A0D7BAR8_9AGAR|nr:B-cell receptor-associated 31-like protein [Cylindrobasidium torrendii FP15055 ss-10]